LGVALLCFKLACTPSTAARLLFFVSLALFQRVVSVTSLWIWSPAIQLSSHSQADADMGDTLKITGFWDLHFSFVKEMSCTHKYPPFP